MNKEKPTTTQIIILVACILGFMTTIGVQNILSNRVSIAIQEFMTNAGKAASDAPDAKSAAAQIIPLYGKTQNFYSGLLGQIQVILSAIMVTINKKRGLIAVAVMNILSVLSTLPGVMHGNKNALVGLFLPIITIGTMGVIYVSLKNNDKATERLNRSYEELIEKNHQIQSAETQLRELAYSDALTGMNNKAWMRETLADTIQEGNPFAFIMLDMDNFKQINDTFGHQVGDTLIKTYATRFQKYCGTKYLCAKVGGDEFALIIKGAVTQADVLNIVSQLQALFGEVANINGQQFRITMSYGIAGSPNDGQNPDSLINAADTALYNAKLQGKDRPVVYSPQSLS